jgi:hypothetical protein
LKLNKLYNIKTLNYDEKEYRYVGRYGHDDGGHYECLRREEPLSGLRKEPKWFVLPILHPK